ncbi:MAG: hypothetical protein A2Y36_11485, partial [Treponema sp. GWA1_62_8]
TTFFRGKGTHPAVLAVWAALIASANLLPVIPMVGLSGTFNVGAILVPLAGIFFGPLAGALCAAIGAFISQLIAPHSAWLGLATFLVATVNAFTAGCVARGRWYLALPVILIGYALWFLTPIGMEAAIFPLIFYTLGLLAVAVGSPIWMNAGRFGPKSPLRAVGVFAAAYAGFVGAAGLANFAGIMLYKWPAAMWQGLAFVSPVERAVFSLGATIIGVPLLISLPKIGVRVGPEAAE